VADSVSAPCAVSLEKEASQRIFDLTLQLESKNALSAGEFTSILHSLDALLATGSSTKASACFRNQPEVREHYQQWFSHQATNTIENARNRLDRTCRRGTDMLIRSHTQRISAAVSYKRLAKAAALADRFEKNLRENPMVSNCRPAQDRVRELLNSYIPNIKNQAAIPVVLQKFESAYLQVAVPLAAAEDALKTRGNSTVPVPLLLESPEGQALIRTQIDQCLTYGHALIELGADATTTIASPSDTTLSLEAAHTFCEQTKVSLEPRLDRFVQHNQAFREATLNRWVRSNIKGWDMEKVFNAKGRPVQDAVLGGGAILWTYQRTKTGRCLQVRFSPRGKKINEQQVSCAARPTN